jgi:DNA-binding transcriptional regulator YiaG
MPPAFTTTTFDQDDKMRSFDKIANPKDIRRKLGMNQQQFWGMIGVTQSGGSRYESGRNMPRPVRELLRLVHVERLDLSRIRKDDLRVLDLLKSDHSDLYKSLKKSAKTDGAGRTHA